MSYAEQLRPPRTLTDRETKKLLATMGKHKAGLRDRLIVSLALMCALRESEIIALDVSDVAKVTDEGIEPKRIIQLRTFKRAGHGDGLSPQFQRVHVGDETWYLLKKYLRVTWGNQDISRSMDGRPLFPTRQSARIGERQIRRMFRDWQERAEFDTLYNFHTLRHTSITNVWRKTGNVRLAQKVARHANVYTTGRYIHPSDEEVARAVKDMIA